MAMRIHFIKQSGKLQLRLQYFSHQRQQFAIGETLEVEFADPIA